MELEDYLAARRRLVENALDEMLPPASSQPSILHEAMRYSVFAGGKRIRPILAMAAAESVGGAAEDVLPLAVGLECIHTYSLIHDDLPTMDDDDTRRGKASAHKAFGEAIAILAGDALLAFAFEVLARPAAVRAYRPERLLAAVRALAEAAGSQKLVAGQVLDLASEGKTVGAETVEYILRTKTGALIRASITSGATLAGATREQVEMLGRFGEDLGAVFQIKDDLLDLEGDPQKVGKAVGKDRDRGKATYPRLIGAEKSKVMMQELVGSGLEAIRPLGRKAQPLCLIANYVADRVS